MTAFFTAIFLAGLLALATGQAVYLTHAGPVPPVVDIVLMNQPPAIYPVCVQDYPNGISVRCDVPNYVGSVNFTVNGVLVRTEMTAPYHIAGHIGGNIVTEVSRWTDFETLPADANGTKIVQTRCISDIGYWTRHIQILPPSCHTPPSPSPPSPTPSTSPPVPRAKGVYIVQAGPVPPVVDITNMVSVPEIYPVCVEDYPNGISVLCVVPNYVGTVNFTVNEEYVYSDHTAPYYIAGGIDAGSMKNIFRWTNYETLPADADGSKTVQTRCYFPKNGPYGYMTRNIKILPPSCHTPPSLSTTGRFRR